MTSYGICNYILVHSWPLFPYYVSPWPCILSNILMMVLFFLRLVYPMLPVSLDCPFGILSRLFLSEMTWSIKCFLHASKKANCKERRIPILTFIHTCNRTPLQANITNNVNKTWEGRCGLIILVKSATFYRISCTEPGNWAVTYICARAWYNCKYHNSSSVPTVQKRDILP
jgi:hypothetical protein